MVKYNLTTFVFLLLMLCTGTAQAQVTMPGIFTDNMVLQRDQPVNIWGWAAKGERVEVTFNGQKQRAKAASDGKWMVTLKPMNFGGPFDMTVRGRNTQVSLTNILIGDVWLCSGQSNMEFTVSSADNAATETANADYPLIRSFNVVKDVSNVPKNDLKGQWEVCSPATVANFSAVGYFYARELYKELNIPIGIINSSWGGTDIETWISPGTFGSLGGEFYARYAGTPVMEDFNAFVARNEVAGKAYREALTTQPGIDGKWYEADYNTSGWKQMDVPGDWNTNEDLRPVDGVVWFSYDFDVPAEYAQGKGTLSLGPIDDADITWINGVKVGETDSYSAKRLYDIPAGTLRPGRNRITIRIVDYAGGGGLYGKAEDVYLLAQSAKIPLTGTWKYKPSIASTDYGYVEISPNLAPSLLYNAMINPIISYTMRGVIWYQGENNAGAAMHYRTLFPTMIQDWRAKWGREFPFYWVQLANFMAKDAQPERSAWAELREAQTMTLSLPSTGQAVITDIGDADDIHPRNKQDVGRRLALNALNKEYGRTDVVYSGPVFRQMDIKGNRAIITFDQANGGLVVKNKYGYVEGFAIAGADRKFYWAKAYVDGDTVVVESDKVTNPVAVRYSWSNNPDVNLYNQAGLPAGPFRTDSW